MVARKSVGYNLFRTAVPFWRRTTCNLRGLPPKRDCISKRGVGQESRAIRYIPMKQKEAVVLDTVSIFKYRGTSKLFFRSVSAQTTRGGGAARDGGQRTFDATHRSLRHDIQHNVVYTALEAIKAFDQTSLPAERCYTTNASCRLFVAGNSSYRHIAAAAAAASIRLVRLELAISARSAGAAAAVARESAPTRRGPETEALPVRVYVGLTIYASYMKTRWTFFSGKISNLLSHI